MNIMTFVMSIGKGLMDLGSKLYEAFYKEVNISWISKLLKTFGVSADLPEAISLSAIILSFGAATLIILILYNIFK